MLVPFSKALYAFKFSIEYFILQCCVSFFYFDCFLHRHMEFEIDSIEIFKDRERRKMQVGAWVSFKRMWKED